MVKIDETKLRGLIRDVPDFPKKGILFKDITTLVKNREALHNTTDYCAKRYADKKIDLVAAIEARGFIFGGALAYKLGCGFVPIRKPNKLPAAKLRREYELEYGTDALEIHSDAVKKGERVLIIDDLLATGGTCLAAANLVSDLGGTVAGLLFIIELTFLKGREKLKGYDIHSLLTYDAE